MIHSAKELIKAATSILSRSNPSRERILCINKLREALAWLDEEELAVGEVGQETLADAAGALGVDPETLRRSVEPMKASSQLKGGSQ